MSAKTRTRIRCWIAAVAASPGFYLWGAYDKKGLWRNIYLGKAGFGDSTNLRARLLEELKDERGFMWRIVRSKGDLLTIAEKIYPSMWHKYKWHWERSLLKEGATHVVWVAAPHLKNEDVRRGEADLIEALNPFANQQRPAPPQSLQEDTARIFKSFRQSIHAGRESRYGVGLKT